MIVGSGPALPPRRVATIATGCYHPDPAASSIRRRHPEPHSSRGPGHRPLKAEITGSNPVCGTTSPASRGTARRGTGRLPAVTRPVLLTCLLAALVACTATAAASPISSPPSDGHAASSAGVCAALLALPDESAALRAFTNLAHDALHGLAGDARLSRSTAAAVLRSMTAVEDDFATVRSPRLAADLAMLRAATDAALGELGEPVPTCPR